MGRSLGEIGKNYFFQEEDGRWNAIVLLKYRHGRRCRSAKGIIVRHSDDGQDRKSLASRVEPPRLFFVFDFDSLFFPASSSPVPAFTCTSRQLYEQFTSPSANQEYQFGLELDRDKMVLGDLSQ
uniref:Uncharacterized protein n=1 Tax=Ditylum brightwellii TaxID=49249 RepID=A0A7S1ZZ03_9STRA|mmetsp:Transcript_4849/g.7434  ORF Transcript_4849/g.7434 Transcript_4849/m.7434 type:complete len:124 (+) Transcript_4849:323-694(+)